MQIAVLMGLLLIMMLLASYNFVSAAKYFKDECYVMSGISLALGLWIVVYPFFKAMTIQSLS